jgi:hypothetical protein
MEGKGIYLVGDSMERSLKKEQVDKGSIRVGIMLDAFVVPAWVKKIITDLKKADFLTLSLVILNTEKTKTSIFKRLRADWPRLLFLIYQNLDRRLFARKERDAFVPTDISSYLRDAEILEVLPERAGFRHRFQPRDIEKIRHRRLDVILRCGFNILTGGVLKSATYGIWSLHHGDNREYRGGPALFWEIFEKSPVSGTILQVLTEELDRGWVIYRSVSGTHPYSLFRNRNQTYWKSSEFMIRRLKDLHSEGWGYIKSLPTYREKQTHTARIFKTPTNLEMISYLAKILWRFILQRYALVRYHEQWRIAFRKRTNPTPEGIDLAFPPFKIVTPPGMDCFADPFVITEKDLRYIFFEQYGPNGGKGVISYITVDDRGHASPPKIVLQKDYHLSYPMIFQWKNSHYMIPETRQNSTIELYRAVDFPDRWELEKVLFHNVQAVDSTLFEHEGRFWLFTNMSVSGGATTDELFLFYSDSPLGEWIPHLKNPVVSDVRRSRPAGKLFWLDGSLYRPSQDNALAYGYAVNLNRVDVLSEESYEETFVTQLKPTWLAGNLKTHTYNLNEELEVTDGMRSLPRSFFRRQ